MPTDAVVQVATLWGTSLLRVAQFVPPPPSRAHRTRGGLASLASEFGAGDDVPWVVARDEGASLLLLPGWRGRVDGPGFGAASFAELIASGKATPSPDRAGAHEVALPLGARARVQPEGCPLAFDVAVTTPAEALARTALAETEPAALLFTALSFALHAGVLAILALFMPRLQGDDAEELDRDRVVVLQKLLNAAAERELETPPADASDAASSPAPGGVEAPAAAGPTGAAGTPRTTSDRGRLAVQGPQENRDPQIVSMLTIREAARFGMIELATAVSASAAAADAPAAPWGAVDPRGRDERSALGHLLFDGSIDDARGTGGLGPSGDGPGGDGHAHAIGLGPDGVGPLDTFGHGAPGPGGVGSSKDRPQNGYHPRRITLREPNVVAVGGHLPPEVVQRIVRQNFGRFRACYEGGLRGDPGLRGRVAVKFLIDRAGAVANALDAGSDLPDRAVVQCIVRGFLDLSFPEPEGGQVTVVYPIALSPAD
jgi:hypothetical protein